MFVICSIEVLFPLKVVLPCVAVALAIILVCSAFFVYRKRKRRMGTGDGKYHLFLRVA